jgi:hypothetical protein
MISVSFSDCQEVRMGSPFSVCKLHLTGAWVPNIEGAWLGLYAHSVDGRRLALAKWDFVKNQPGFRIVFVDEELKSVEESDRISGCCESIAWGQDVIFWKAFLSQTDRRNGEVKPKRTIHE